MSIADKLTTIAENEQKVFEAGKKSQYDLFWDHFQQNGQREGYQSAFQWWDDEIFYPKYDIIAGQSDNVSTAYLFYLSKINNIKERFEDCGVKLICKSPSAQAWFHSAKTTEIPVLDFSAYTGNSLISMQYTFYNATNLKKVHIKNARFAYITSPFSYCSSLEEIVLENVVFTATNFSGLYLTSCTKLTKDSLLAVLNALEQTASSPKISLGSTNLAKLSDAEIAIATQKGWTVA